MVLHRRPSCNDSLPPKYVKSVPTHGRSSTHATEKEEEWKLGVRHCYRRVRYGGGDGVGNGLVGQCSGDSLSDCSVGNGLGEGQGDGSIAELS